MSIWMRVEDDAVSRILAAAELIYDSPDDVPEALRVVEGDVYERCARRLGAIAGLLEHLVLESVEAGLGEKLKGYSSLSVLRATSDDDLERFGLSKATVKSMRERLTRHFPKGPFPPEGTPPSNWLEDAEEPPADLKDIVTDLGADDPVSERKRDRR